MDFRSQRRWADPGTRHRSSHPGPIADRVMDGLLPEHRGFPGARAARLWKAGGKRTFRGPSPRSIRTFSVRSSGSWPIDDRRSSSGSPCGSSPPPEFPPDVSPAPDPRGGMPGSRSQPARALLAERHLAADGFGETLAGVLCTTRHERAFQEAPRLRPGSAELALRSPRDRPSLSPLPHSPGPCPTPSKGREDTRASSSGARGRKGPGGSLVEGRGTPVPRALLPGEGPGVGVEAGDAREPPS